jgi:hypothetical protein|tara:strand:+ start:18543 stop:18719 length:177 start_codon:yes stop_codon:yes gene_type:complete
MADDSPQLIYSFDDNTFGLYEKGTSSRVEDIATRPRSLGKPDWYKIVGSICNHLNNKK